jgi:ribosomal protein S6
VTASVDSVKELDRQLSLNEAVMRTKVMRAEEPSPVGVE